MPSNRLSGSHEAGWFLEGFLEGFSAAYLCQRVSFQAQICMLKPVMVKASVLVASIESH